jgi:putative hydrolase of the HAD superfamily
MGFIKTIGFDADDTLWHNERFFGEAQIALKDLLSEYADGETISKAILEMQRQNLETLGYGIKSFTIAMMQVALDLSNEELDTQSMRSIINIGKEMMAHPVDFIDGVVEVLDNLSETYELVLITKGDLMDQERKVSLSKINKWIVSEKHSTTYKNIFSRLGNVDESVMVGNSIKSDAVPAVQAGAWGIHVPYPITWELELAEPMTDHERYFEAKSLSNAVDIIRSI